MISLYVRTYICILCVEIPLYPIIVHISLLFSLSERSVTISGNRCILFRTRLIVLRRILELARQCWLTRAAGRLSIDVEGSTMKRGLFTYFCPLKQQSNDLKILINLKNVSS